MREIDIDKENLRDFLGKPLLRIGEGYIGGKPELTPTNANIGHAQMGVNDTLWLMDSVSLKRVAREPIRGYQIHKVFGLEYQFSGDLCQVCIELPLPQTHLYEFDSDPDAEGILKQIRKGKEAVTIL